MSLVSTSTVSRAAAPPDLDGVWLPDVGDQKRQEQGNIPPWKPDILPQVQHMAAEEKVGRPSLEPGKYFRLLLIGYFEGIDSERGIAWRVADSLSLRQFLGYAIDQPTPRCCASLSRVW